VFFGHYPARLGVPLASTRSSPCVSSSARLGLAAIDPEPAGQEECRAMARMTLVRWLMGPMLLGVTAISGPAAPAGAQTVALTNTTFVDASGAHPATFSFSGPCNGNVTVTLAISRPSGTDTRVVHATSTMAPDLCGIACLDCPVPFVWTIKGGNVVLAGGGVAGGGWSLHGRFQEGVLEVRGLALGIT
jgi:hypothetical protein